MKKLFLVRHGESEWNVLKKIQGQQDIMLTDKGRLQAEQIGTRLMGSNIESIYSSDLSRAYDTAQIIGKMINIDVKTMPELREIKFGRWEGSSYKDTSSTNADELFLWKKAPEELNLEGVETLEELQLRAGSGINKIISNETANNILIVSHSATLKTIVLKLLDIDLANFKNLTLDNVSLSIIEFRDYNRVLKLYNDSSHVKEILKK